MRGRHRIPPRTIKRFLQLAAATFAIGLGATPARADGENWQASTGGREDDMRADDTADVMPRGYQHLFALPASAAARLHERRALADVRVLDATGRKALQLALHGESMVGPLAHGSYTVLLRTNGLTEVQRIRIGPDTLPYLHFTETA